MSEKALTDEQAVALSGTTDATTGVTFPQVASNNWAAAIYRTFQRMIDALLRANDLRVYPVEGNADAVGVRPGRIRFGGTALAYAGADPAVDSLTNNATTYVWAYNNSGVIAISSSTSAWPAYPHRRLAEVTMASGAITAILDRRSEGLSDVLLPTYTTGARPAASTAGRVIFNTTTSKINIDTGAAWVLADGTSA